MNKRCLMSRSDDTEIDHLSARLLYGKHKQQNKDRKDLSPGWVGKSNNTTLEFCQWVLVVKHGGLMGQMVASP